MKANYLLFIVCFWFLPMQSQYTSVPDPVFEQELINQGIDTNPVIDHQVLTSGINTITTLIMDVNNINNFGGLQGFTNLETLKIYGYNPAPALNLENNLLLKHITLYGIEAILSLDLTNNVLLETIDVSNNSLTNINISTCINLKELDLLSCPITNIDLSNNQNLEKLAFGGLNLTSLNINNNLALKEIALLNLQFTSLDFSSNTNLETILLRNIPFTSLDFSNNIHLKEITMRNLGGPATIFSGLLFSNNINLKKIIVDLVSFYPTINLQNNLQLEICVLYSAGLFYLDVLNNISLKTLRIDGNFFDDIDIQNLSQLQIFGCSYNNISSLNFDNHHFLEVLYCDNNDLHYLSIQNGANSLLNGIIDGTPTNDRFIATNNPNLRCIYVDDVPNCNANWLSKDSTSYYVSSVQECNNLNLEIFKKNTLSIFPNPTNDFINISHDNETLINSKIKIYNILGEIIYSENSTTEDSKIRVENFSKGIYILSVEKDGTILKSKFIVQ